MSTVVVLLSDKRSGSTMLQEELCGHPSINHVSYSPHTFFETHHWLKSAVMLNRPGMLFAGGKPYAGYGTRENARTYLLDTLLGNIPDYVAPNEQAALVFDGWEALCRHYASPVFFEKSPQLLANWAGISLFLEWIVRTDFDVRVIGLVRNPLAVQYSAQELFSTEANYRQFSWLNAHKNLLAVQAMLPPEMFKLVRYEDILSEPKQKFSDILDFLGVQPEPIIGSGVHSNSLNRWIDDKNYSLQLDPAVAQIARAFGYSSEELRNPNISIKGTSDFTVSKRRRRHLWITRFRDRVVRPMYLRIRSNKSRRR